MAEPFVNSPTGTWIIWIAISFSAGSTQNVVPQAPVQ
jgi:hypothetical protein